MKADLFWILWTTAIAVCLIALGTAALGHVGWPQPIHTDLQA